MSKHYFALDGNYGLSWGMTICDTTDWTEAMWDAIDSVSDDSRPDLAYHFAEDKHQYQSTNGVCNNADCGLTKEQTTKPEEAN
ncbi:hypothetical protein UFOVP45_115 [uncultured Caudovirales phage]|uniref:Uncharacterized protein n=1 Tax=uncultured Caudovirales phage TaxID=2100421 RepID=A0A6J5KNQ2_9CAUD|nr:hypothetical protein UFOVP45_115 [uncultured Caudovirales phage]